MSQQKSVFSLHCSSAVRVSVPRFFLQSVWIFLTCENTLSQSALLRGRHSNASIVFLRFGNLSCPMGVTIFRMELHTTSILMGFSSASRSFISVSSRSWYSSNSSLSSSWFTKGVNLLARETTAKVNETCYWVCANLYKKSIKLVCLMLACSYQNTTVEGVTCYSNSKFSN